MKSKLYWGIATLIILLFGTAFVVIIMRERAEIAQLRQEKADFEKVIAEQKKQQTQEVVESNQPPPDEAGFKWVRHGDHWDKIPVANDGEGNTLNPSIWYPPEILALSDEERRELYLQRELEWQAKHAAEKAENAKIAENMKADYEHENKKQVIRQKIADLNRQMGDVDNITSDDFETSEEFYEWARKIKGILQQQRVLFAELAILKEQDSNDD